MVLVTNDRVTECFAYAISKGVEIIIPDNTLKSRNTANRKAVSRNG